MKPEDRTFGAIIALAVSKGAGAAISVGVVIAMANAFGAGATTDAFFFARRMIENLIAMVERGAHDLLVPGYVRTAHRQGTGALRSRSGRTARLALLISAAACLIAFVSARPMLALLAPGFSAQSLEKAVLFFRIILLSLPLAIMTSISVAALNSLRHFALPAMARFLPRLFMLVVLATPLVVHGLTLVSIAFVLGTLVMTVIFGWLAHRAFRGEPEREPPIRTPGPTGRRERGATGTRLVALIVIQAHTMAAAAIDFGFASMAGEGSIAALEYGQRLVNMAPGLVASSIAVVYYTELSAALGRGDQQHFTMLVANAMRRSTLVAVPFAAMIFALREPVVLALLAHGEYSLEAAAMTTSVVGILAPLLLISLVLGTLFSILLADDESNLLQVAIVSSALAIIVRLGFDWTAIDRLGLVTVPIGMLLGLGTLFLVMYVMIRRHYRRPLLGHDGVAQTLRVLGAGGVTLVAMSALRNFAWDPGLHRIEQILIVGMIAAIGFAIYFAAGWLLRVPELRRLPLRRAALPNV